MPTGPILADPIPAWNALGIKIGGGGTHRLALAMRVARAAASGGGRLTSHEEDEIARWFVGVVDSAIEARRAGKERAL